MVIDRTRFSQASFASAKKNKRSIMCVDLSLVLSSEMKRVLGQDRSVRRQVVEFSKIVKTLKSLGHDLWGWDEDNDFEIWGPDYMKPNQSGILVTIYFPDNVDVSWQETPEAPQRQ